MVRDVLRKTCKAHRGVLYHEACFTCSKCGETISSYANLHEESEKPTHLKCPELDKTKCARCKRPCHDDYYEIKELVKNLVLINAEIPRELFVLSEVQEIIERVRACCSG